MQAFKIYENLLQKPESSIFGCWWPLIFYSKIAGDAIHKKIRLSYDHL